MKPHVQALIDAMRTHEGGHCQIVLKPTRRESQESYEDRIHRRANQFARQNRNLETISDLAATAIADCH